MSDEAPFPQADRWDAADHPSPEKLSAYQAGELPAGEDDAIQEHVTQCEFCAELLLDLQRFLDQPSAEPAQRGIVDFEAAVEVRELRRRIERETERKPFFASARGGYSVAAALLAVSIGLVLWNLNLVRESREPKPLSTVRTLEAKESFRGGGVPAVEEPVTLPAQITLNLPVETPEPLYRVELFRRGSLHAAASLELRPQGAELRFVLPERALAPGSYSLRVRGLRGGRPSSTAWTYDLILGPRQ